MDREETADRGRVNCLGLREILTHSLLSPKASWTLPSELRSSIYTNLAWILNYQSGILWWRVAGIFPWIITYVVIQCLFTTSLTNIWRMVAYCMVFNKLSCFFCQLSLLWCHIWACTATQRFPKLCLYFLWRYRRFILYSNSRQDH